MLVVVASFSKNGDGTWLETEALGYGVNRLALCGRNQCIFNTHHPMVNQIRIQIVPSVDRPL